MKTMPLQSLELWKLSYHDSQLVKSLLDNPPKANDELKNLLALSFNMMDLAKIKNPTNTPPSQLE